MKKYFYLSIGFMLSLMLGSCVKGFDHSHNTTPEQILAWDMETIANYIESHGIEGTVTISTGLTYKIHNPGEEDAKRPTRSSIINVSYRGYFTNDRTFDRRDDFTDYLNRQIEGWQQGIPLIREGGSITLFIPSGLAWGRYGTSVVPPDTVVIFDIDLKGVE